MSITGCEHTFISVRSFDLAWLALTANVTHPMCVVRHHDRQLYYACMTEYVINFDFNKSSSKYAMTLA